MCSIFFLIRFMYTIKLESESNKAETQHKRMHNFSSNGNFQKIAIKITSTLHIAG